MSSIASEGQLTMAKVQSSRYENENNLKVQQCNEIKHFQLPGFFQCVVHEQMACWSAFEKWQVIACKNYTQ